MPKFFFFFNIKTSTIKEIMNTFDVLQACESTCYEYTPKDQVLNGQEDIVRDKEEFIMKKDKKKGNNDREKNMKKKVFHTMKVIYERPLK